MAYRKTAAELRAENRMLRRYGIGTNVTRIFITAVRVGGWTVILLSLFNMVQNVVDSLAGMATLADINIGINASLDGGSGGDTSVPGSIAFPLLFAFGVLIGGAGLIFGYVQMKLRKRTINQLSGFRVRYELTQDDRRSSSDLGEAGDEPQPERN